LVGLERGQLAVAAEIEKGVLEELGAVERNRAGVGDDLDRGAAGDLPGEAAQAREARVPLAGVLGDRGNEAGRVAERARRRAREALTATDEADARDIAKVLLPGAEADARKVAAEILERTRVERKAWVFVALAAVLVALMIAIGAARA